MHGNAEGAHFCGPCQRGLAEVMRTLEGCVLMDDVHSTLLDAAGKLACLFQYMQHCFAGQTSPQPDRSHRTMETGRHRACLPPWMTRHPGNAHARCLCCAAGPMCGAVGDCSDSLLAGSQRRRAG